MHGRAARGCCEWRSWRGSWSTDDGFHVLATGHWSQRILDAGLCMGRRGLTARKTGESWTCLPQPPPNVGFGFVDVACRVRVGFWFWFSFGFFPGTCACCLHHVPWASLADSKVLLSVITACKSEPDLVGANTIPRDPTCQRKDPSLNISTSSTFCLVLQCSAVQLQRNRRLPLCSIPLRSHLPTHSLHGLPPEPTVRRRSLYQSCLQFLTRPFAFL